MIVIAKVFTILGFTFLGISIFKVVVDYFSQKTKKNKNKKYTSNLAGHMAAISLSAQKQKKIDEETLFETNIKRWKETRYFQFVLQAIKDAAEDGKKGIILTTWVEKTLPTKTIYSEATNPFTGWQCFYTHKYFSFTQEEFEEFNNFMEFDNFIGNLEKYLRDEGFKVTYRDSDSILIAW